MPRPALHPTDELLDAARDLVVEAGPRAAGIRDIARRSGAPSGSLYHRFGSRDELVARAWLRAVRRFQAGYLEALGQEEPREAAACAVRFGVAFALSAPADARLLLDYSRAGLLDSEPEGEVADEVARVNAPLEAAVRDLAVRVFGDAGVEAIERTSYAVIDLPLAVVRRHLLAGTLGEDTAGRLEPAVLALLDKEAR
ncbi:MAG TPA: helix-turn-helix domain-containing protein [Solirubrobacteraceae bacterium]|jgi:AcrR family transcriptional regulator|nr:helix-turn-helix domain-containing protein [Solirubrobacteraceae bacterium]